MQGQRLRGEGDEGRESRRGQAPCGAGHTDRDPALRRFPGRVYKEDLMRLVFASDVHGSEAHYGELVEILRREDARALVLGGDLLPPPLGLSSPEARAASVRKQSDYLIHQLLPRLDEVRAGGADVLLLLGNYDLAAVSETFETACADRGFLTLHDRVQRVEGVTFAGLSWVNPTPFHLKDWEAYDLEKDELPVGALDPRGPRSVYSTPDGREKFAARPTLWESLNRLAERVEPAAEPAIYVLHAPPHNTGLDAVSKSADPVGSRAVRLFLEERQPALSLHGHIHESPHVSGRWAARLQRTVAVQPGQAPERLHAVVLDTDDPAGSAQHTVFGALTL